MLSRSCSKNITLEIMAVKQRRLVKQRRGDGSRAVGARGGRHADLRRIELLRLFDGVNKEATRGSFGERLLTLTSFFFVVVARNTTG